MTAVNVPSDFTRIVQSTAHFCAYVRMNYCKASCVSQEVCDSEDPSHSWKFEQNPDGTYNILNKKNGLYLNTSFKSGESFEIASLSKKPESFVLVPSIASPEAFYIKPNKNKKICFVSVDGNFQNCEEGDMIQIYFFDTLPNEQVVVPNTFYSIKWIDTEYERIQNCWSSLGNQYKFCSFQGPDMAFKFVPQTDGTFMIINGLGQAGTVDQRNKGVWGETVMTGLLNFKKPDPNNPLQRFRPLRSPHYPENIIIKAVEIDFYALRNQMLFGPSPHKLYNLYLHFFTLGEACSEKVVYDDVWYLLRVNNKGYREQCLHYSTNEGKVLFDDCIYNDFYLFKFIWDKETHSYYIYNKSQGDKVLTVYAQNGNIVDSKSGTFEPKVHGDDKQRWNTTTRHLVNSVGFFIYSRYQPRDFRQPQKGIAFSGYSNGVAPMIYENPIFAESVEFNQFTKGMLSSISGTSDVLGVPPVKTPQCSTQIF